MKFKVFAILCILAPAFSVWSCDDYMTKDVYIGVIPEEDSDSDDGGENADTPADDDDDGLGNEVEETFEMAPRIADTDKDGYADGLEFVVDSADPLDSSKSPTPLNRSKQVAEEDAIKSDSDRDSDGLGDTFEREHSLHIDNPDTDADGYADGLELVAGSDPFRPGDRPERQAPPAEGADNGLTTAPSDSDRDGVADRLEALNGTLSNRRDSDGDGFSDGIEFLMGSDATSFLSVPNFSVPTPPESVSESTSQSTEQDTTSGTQDEDSTETIGF